MICISNLYNINRGRSSELFLKLECEGLKQDTTLTKNDVAVKSGDVYT